MKSTGAQHFASQQCFLRAAGVAWTQAHDFCEHRLITDAAARVMSARNAAAGAANDTDSDAQTRPGPEDLPIAPDHPPPRTV